MIDIGPLLGSAIYVIVWCLTLFLILPLGLTSRNACDDPIPGSDPGAPARPCLRRKFLATTLLAGAAYAILHVALTRDYGADSAATRRHAESRRGSPALPADATIGRGDPERSSRAPSFPPS